MTNKRPVIITVICVLGFIGSIFSIPLIFSEAARSIGAWYPLSLAFSTLVGLVSMIGFWMMKKWGVITYMALFAINQVIFITASIWTISSVVLPGIVIIIGLLNFEDMQ